MNSKPMLNAYPDSLAEQEILGDIVTLLENGGFCIPRFFHRLEPFLGRAWRPEYLGQMDVNIQSPKVWEFYRETLEKIASYGAAIVRLDAFAYAPKTPGKNFLMIRKHGNFYRRFMRWQNLWDLRFCRRSTQRMMKKYMRHLQKKAMQPMTFSCRDWSLMRLRTGGEHTLQHGRRRLWKRRSPRSTCSAVTTASRFWI